MKTQSLKLFAATLVLGIFAVSSAFAQQSLDFDIPFDFQISKTKMESGKYQIKKMDRGKFILKNVETNKSIFIVSDAGVGNERSVKKEQIVFNKYGDTYFLREIYANRGTIGRELAESKAERNIRKDYKNKPKLAKKDKNPEQVSINSTQ